MAQRTGNMFQSVWDIAGSLLDIYDCLLTTLLNIQL